MPRPLSIVALSMVLLVQGMGAAEESPVNGRAEYLTEATRLKDIKSPETVVILSVDGSDTDQMLTFDESCLADLSRFTNAKVLVLSCEGATDAVIPHIVKLKKLQALVIYSCSVTDKGIQQLKALDKLETVGFCLTKVTDDGMKELQKSLPKAHLENCDFKRNRTIFKWSGCTTKAFEKRYLGGD
jgi:hypothetical protein